MRKTPTVTWLPLLVVAILGGVAMRMANARFATEYNLFVILQSVAAFALIGFAVMVVLSVGDISLAVGGIASTASVLFGWLVQIVHIPSVLAALIVGLYGLVAGVTNGILITKSRLSGFIVTLVTGVAWGGVALGFTHASAFQNIPSDWTAFGQARIGFFPMIGIVTVVIAVGLVALYRWSPLGRAMLAIGGNKEAALLVGISPARQLIVAHSLSGLLAAAAALLYIARIGSAPPDLGADWVLISFAVAIIGGTALFGGRVSVVGAVIAAIVLAAIDNALILLNVSQYGITFAQGFLILLAILLGNMRNFGSILPKLKRRLA